MLRKLVLAGVAVAATGAISGAQAQDGDLVRIATQTIDLANPKVSIDLSKTKGAFHGVRVAPRAAISMSAAYRSSTATAPCTTRTVSFICCRVSAAVRSMPARPVTSISSTSLPRVARARRRWRCSDTSPRSQRMARQPSKLPSGSPGCYGEIPASKAAVAATAAKDKPQEVTTSPTSGEGDDRDAW